MFTVIGTRDHVVPPLVTTAPAAVRTVTVAAVKPVAGEVIVKLRQARTVPAPVQAVRGTTASA